MSIQVGQKAPDFSLVSLGENGPEVVTLSEQTGEQNILLLFVPMAFTGKCTEEFCEISAGLGAYTDLNCKGIDYPQFLPDKNLIMSGVPKRSAFLIDKEGTVQFAQVNDNPGELPDFEAIKAKLAELT